LELFADVGIEAALVLSFTEELCRLDPEDYVRTVLVECMGAKSLSVGFNHRFGRNRVGDPELLRQLGLRYDYVVNVAGEVIIDGSPVSSSRIREAIQNGSVDEARKLLSRPYAIQGLVEHGEGRGHELGFPTANLHIPDEQVMPAMGVYACYSRLPDNSRLPSVVNIGKRPTFGDNKPITTEVHLLDYDGNLYGRDVQLEFISYIRPEKKFASVDELKAQIALDCTHARQVFTNNPADSLKTLAKLPAEQH
jgi:riboflavin kinase / FMN adenylyltransferase